MALFTQNKRLLNFEAKDFSQVQQICKYLDPHDFVFIVTDPNL